MLSNAFNDCLADSCEKRGCKLNIGSIKRLSKIIDCDTYKKKMKHQDEICDYIIFTRFKKKMHILGVVELKSGRVNIEKAIGQIRKGAQLAEQISLRIKKPVFFPILVHMGNLKHHGKSITVMEVKQLSKSSLFFKGNKYEIQLERNGANYCSIIQESGISF